MDVHPGLLSLIDKMLTEATSADNQSMYVSPRLRNDILYQINEHCLSVMYYEKLMVKMRSNNSLTRNLTFQILSELVLHSEKVRYLFVQSLSEMMDLVFGIRQDVPEPELAAVDLKNRFIESLEIFEKRFGKIYPNFSVCREYAREKVAMERRSQKRMKPPSQTPQKKSHSMDILQDAVNKTIWELNEDMETFEYQYNVSIQDMYSFFDLWSSDNPLEVETAPKKEKRRDDEVVKKAYEGMRKKHGILVNELIPTLERNRMLLKVRNTKKSLMHLEKIEEMLERCNISLSRCTRLLYSGKQLYGNEDMYSSWL